MKSFYISIVENINLNIIDEAIIKYIKKFDIILLRKKVILSFQIDTHIDVNMKYTRVFIKYDVKKYKKYLI